LVGQKSFFAVLKNVSAFAWNNFLCKLVFSVNRYTILSCKFALGLDTPIELSAGKAYWYGIERRFPTAPKGLKAAAKRVTKKMQKF